MQEHRDNLEFIVKEAFGEVKIDENYNQKLMDRVHEEYKVNKKDVRETRVAALSLIFSGICIAIIYTGNVQYKLINLTNKFLFIAGRINILKMFIGG